MRKPLAFIVFIFIAFSCYSQQQYSCIKVRQFKQMLDLNHIETLIWDDAFAVSVVDQLFYLIDPSAHYFTDEEKKFFIAKAPKILGQLQANDCSVIAELADRYTTALHRADQIINKISQRSFNFNQADTIRFQLHGDEFVSPKELETHWIRYLKLSVLLANTSEESKESNTTALIKATKKERNIIKRRLEVGIEEYLFNTLLNAIATVYDPHTEYFPKEKKQVFMDRVSSDTHSFGVVLGEDQVGNVAVERIIPGSSAWNSGKVHVGDVITEISSPHMEKVDAALFTADELDEVMESISTEMELSVKKVNGEELKVTLIKLRLIEDDNKIKSLILSDDKTKFGYINLPVFFSKNEITKSGCANELAKEIIQLKNAKINGLILDIRNNGGGDLGEAIDLVGIFIDRGAVGIVKERGHEAETLKDSNLGTVYDGPLLVMINGGSASASEFFAAAMRDHNRAILVGTNTYGKGTGQHIMPFTGNDGDLVKITSFRFYSASGTSNQGNGVTPDVLLPDLFSMLDYRERTQRHFLKPETIQKKTYYTPLAPIPTDVLRESSSQRLNKSEFFTEVSNHRKHMSPYVQNGKFNVPLTPEGFQQMNQLSQDKKTDKTPVADRYKISLTKFNQRVNTIDAYGSKTFELFMGDISRDNYILESLNILNHYLSLKK